MIGIFVLVPILFNFGWENTLYLPGQTPPYTYSDMNGYGHFVPALFWSILYWFSIFAVLGVLSIGMHVAVRTILSGPGTAWRSSGLRDSRLRPSSLPVSWSPLEVGTSTMLIF